MSTLLKYTAQEDQIKTTKGGEKEDSDEEILTPGNLMAFAWHVSQGMVREFTCPFQKSQVIHNFYDYCLRLGIMETKNRYFLGARGNKVG